MKQRAGLLVAGMAWQGWDVHLTAYVARDWRATFCPVGIAHSIVGGSAWEPTPWRAALWTRQVAASGHWRSCSASPHQHGHERRRQRAVAARKGCAGSTSPNWLSWLARLSQRVEDLNVRA